VIEMFIPLPAFSSLRETSDQEIENNWKSTFRLAIIYQGLPTLLQVRPQVNVNCILEQKEVIFMKSNIPRVQLYL